MELRYLGGNCVQIASRQATVLVDPYSADYKLPPLKSKADIVLLTNAKLTQKPTWETFLIDGPGEYEIKDVAIEGFAAQFHSDKEGRAATMYRITVGDIAVLVTGHVSPDLSEDQLENIDGVDVVIIPVGGHGLTLDALEAVRVVQQLEPKLVIPTHFDDKKTTFPVPQESLEHFVKEIGIQPEKSPRLKLKPQSFGETLQVVQLERE